MPARRVGAPTAKPGPACAMGRKGMTMLKNFDEFQKFGNDGMNVVLKQFGVVGKGVQAIATEVADYSKEAFETTAAATEKLLGAKSFEKAIEVQTEFLKASYEGFVARSGKFSTLYADLAKETCKPLEGYLGKAAPTK
jgi:beta-glucanase (GH16 family)